MQPTSWIWTMLAWTRAAAARDVFVSGGYDPISVNYEATIYTAQVQPDGSLDSWSGVASLPTARSRHGVVSTQGYLFVAGGYNPGEGGYASCQDHWIAALRREVELVPAAEVALETMLISEGIYLSDRLGREVAAEEVVAASRSTAEAV